MNTEIMSNPYRRPSGYLIFSGSAGVAGAGAKTASSGFGSVLAVRVDAAILEDITAVGRGGT